MDNVNVLLSALTRACHFLHYKGQITDAKRPSILSH